jgi:hypothetical protein
MTEELEESSSDSGSGEDHDPDKPKVLEEVKPPPKITFTKDPVKIRKMRAQTKTVFCVLIPVIIYGFYILAFSLNLLLMKDS